MRRLLVLGLTGCNAILGIDEPTLGRPTFAIDGSVLSPIDGSVLSGIDAPAGSTTYDITIVKTSTGSGLVVSNPPGIHCDSDCTTQTASFNRSQDVTLTATPGPGTLLNDWSGNCSANGSSCLVAAGTTATITVGFTKLVNNVVFVSSMAYKGTIGGLDGADTQCRTLAAQAGLEGTFVAFLSTTTTAARSRLVLPGGSTEARGFVRPDGRPIADTITDLLDGHRMWYAANTTEKPEVPPSNQAWTGSTTNGMSGPDDCAGWTSTDAGASGEVGLVSGGPNWANAGKNGCDTANAIYCVQVDRADPLAAPAPASGKLIFLSKGTFAPGAGIGGADGLCAGESSGAKALLATSTRAASSLLSGGYVRADGVPVDLSSTIAAARAGVWVHADLTYVVPLENTPIRVWNGSQVFNAMPAAAGHTCGDWASTSGMGDIGFAVAGVQSWGVNKQSCTFGLRLYCVAPQ